MKVDVLTIGGGPGGIIASVTAKKNYPEKNVLLVRKEEKAVVPCGIPYIFGTLDSVDKNIMSSAVLTNNGVDLLIDEVVDLNVEEKIAKTKEGKEISYDKLILATGSQPIVLPIPGHDLEGVWFVRKSYEYLSRLKEAIDAANDIVIIGGGFIGVEFADEITKKGKKVTIVEILPHLLGKAFDEEFCKVAEEELTKKGVKVLTGSKVKSIEGDGKVEKVVLDDGSEIKADVVIMSVGAKPEVSLAKKAGIKLGYTGAIEVDTFMRTSAKDVFAVGDCAEHKCYLTDVGVCPMLASIAVAGARLAGSNLYQIRVMKRTPESISVFSTFVGETAFGSCGLTETMARSLGYDIVVGEFTGADKHPGTLPDTKKQTVKLVVARSSGMIIGAQVMGGKSIGELINLLGLAIQEKLTAAELATTQIGTHPLLTAPPTAYPVIMAALNVLSKL